MNEKINETAIVNDFASIYISYHKPAVIIENEIFHPIQSGKATSTIDLKIMGDDTGDNISEMGNQLNELTILYWMWKNDLTHSYLGLCHYRRIFSFNPNKNKIIRDETEKISFLDNNSYNDFGWCESSILEEIKKNDIIVSRYWDNPCGGSQGKHYQQFHGEDAYNRLINGVKRYAPDYYPYLESCLSGRKLIIGHMFVMRRDILNEYCNWLFPLLKKITPEVDPSATTTYNLRQGFAAERLFHIFIEKIKTERKDIKIKHLPFIFIEDTDPEILSLPRIQSNKKVIPIVTSVNETNFDVFTVLLESIIKVRGHENFYDIIILTDEISNNKKRTLDDHVLNYDNIKIRYFKMNRQLLKKELNYGPEITREKFFKLKIPAILPEYEKVIYVDYHTIFLEDPALLFTVDIKQCYAAVTYCLKQLSYCTTNRILNYLNKEFSFKEYKKIILNFQNQKDNNIFHTGLMVLNLYKIRQDKVDQKTLYLFNRDNYYFGDQDIFNICFKDRIKYLDLSWNLVPIVDDEITNSLPDIYAKNYNKALERPMLINFALFNTMPWIHQNVLLQEKFWSIARYSPFYESIFLRFVNNCIEKSFNLDCGNTNKNFFDQIHTLIWRIKDYSIKELAEKIFQKLKYIIILRKSKLLDPN
nr:DUF4422 domain-containing protein [uncultured Methanospirillum sp.]